MGKKKRRPALLCSNCGRKAVWDDDEKGAECGLSFFVQPARYCTGVLLTARSWDKITNKYSHDAIRAMYLHAPVEDEHSQCDVIQGQNAATEEAENAIHTELVDAIWSSVRSPLLEKPVKEQDVGK